MHAPKFRGRPVPPAPIIAAVERVIALRRAGIDVISFGMGESDLGTPTLVRDAVHAALDADRLTCTPPAGGLELREAVATWLGREYERRFSPDEVIVSPGSKYALYALFLVLLGDGDEVIIPVPAWPTIASLVNAVGGRATLVPCRAEDGFAPQLEAIERAVTPRTQALYLANPGNPTGAVLPAAVLEPIVRLCATRSITLIADGAYRSHCYDAPVPNLAALADEHGAACVIVETLSKRHNMSGWRVGFIAGHAELVARMADVQAQTLSCVPAIGQAAALAALSVPVAEVEASLEVYRRRRRAMLDGLAAIPGFRLVPEPTGAFFVFPDVSSALGKHTSAGRAIDTDTALAEYLLDAARVAVMPGTVFGGPGGHLRLSYTLPEARITEACARIRAAMDALR